MFKNEQLSCLYDRGRIKSIGRFVTRIGETIEVGLCDFDGYFSGFKWNNESGWEPVFLQQYNFQESKMSLWDDTPENPYSVEEIEFELNRFLKNRS